MRKASGAELGKLCGLVAACLAGLAGAGLPRLPAQENVAPPTAPEAPGTARIVFLSPAPFSTPLPDVGPLFGNDKSDRGTVTVSVRDTAGKRSQIVKDFEVRKMPF